MKKYKVIIHEEFTVEAEKQQYEQHLKTKGLYEQFDFVPLPQEIMDECNTDWQNESENDLENALDHKINKWGL
mgnify:CR=1 FL=1